MLQLKEARSLADWKNNFYMNIEDSIIELQRDSSSLNVALFHPSLGSHENVGVSQSQAKD